MKKYITTICLSLSCSLAFAQTEGQAENANATHHEQKAYPIVKATCYDKEMSKDIQGMHYASAKAVANKLISTAKRKKESTAQYEEIIDICDKGENGLRGTDQVIIVDSIVLDKSAFLSAYPLSEDLGKLTLSENGETVEYSTQLNGMVFRPETIVTDDGSSSLQIMRHFVEDGAYTESTLMEGLGIEGDVNYPFLLPDGQKFYFAARTDDGYGNYDLYVTRYDSDSKRFYRAENMGFPYNSYANDYMLALDEEHNIGWFASDRYQPAGKVCVYTFIPNQSRHTIDFENTPLSVVQTKASLHSLKALSALYTSEEKALQQEAINTLASLSQSKKSSVKGDFLFILNDEKDITSLSQFSNEEAKKLCAEWLQKSKNLATLNEQLEEIRLSSSANKERDKVINLEKRIQELHKEVHSIEKRIRQLELSN